MDNIKKKSRWKITSEKLFFIAYGLFLIATLSTTTFYFQYIKGLIYNMLLISSILLLFLREFFNHKIKKKVVLGIFVCFLLVLLLIIADVSNRNVLILTVFFVYFARNVSFDKIARFSAVTSLGVLVFIILSALIGIIPNYTTFSGGRERTYIGFLYALFPSTIMFNVTAIQIYLKKTCIKWSELLVLLIINFYIFDQTSSRLTFALSFLLILIIAFMKIFPHVFENKKILRDILSFGFLAWGMFSLIIIILYNNGDSLLRIIDLFLDHRIEIANDAWNRYGLSVLGNHFSMIGNGLDMYGNNTSRMYLAYSYIDNWYAQILLRNGLLFLAIIMILLLIVSRKAVNIDKTGVLNVILFLLAFQCVIQDSIMCIYFNTFVFLIGFYIMNSISDIRRNYINGR